MTLALEWVLCYALPAWIAVGIAYRLPYKEQRITIIHMGLLVSIALLLFVGSRLVWSFPLWGAILTVAVFFASVLMLGIRDAVLYLLSCIIQESCILLAGALLMPITGVVVAALATAIVFALAHRMNLARWWFRFLIIGGWGFCSVLLYTWLREPLLNIALHAAGGAILIYWGVLFPNRLTKRFTN